MTDENTKFDKETVVTLLGKRAWDFGQRAWRPAGTAVAVGLALLLMWHVVEGKNGLTVWHKKRSEDQQLQKEIKQLENENAQLREHVEELKHNPDAIEHAAREKLHYAKPNEVIVALPTQAQDKTTRTGN
jgi:cell division protein FtsB